MALSQIQWPISLPQRPLQEGYQESPGWDVVTSDFDVGLTRQRRRSSAALMERKTTYLLKGSAQKEEFESFVELAQGRSFWWPDAGSGMVYRYARILERPVIAPKAPNVWTVQFTLGIWPFVTRENAGE